jgi:hypothetical protein
MNDRPRTARRYREYAEELRVIAADKHVPENRDALLKIADDYEQMAAALEAVGDPSHFILKPIEKSARQA